ncbi:peptidoglycan/LPS O-acetylase OafA/YrhL [Caulobacter ginsengisoli]|uniref:Peptidoglycan/LPS O-acetylase OafA/YrhL n=1 Tax=Caulobacter ginsengisoli TaxID=400775 RepID=A0ABU0IQD8_9CAUL|nr:peptidoglycan/LPS O-acetylase OafA/YrhL [Caulobacter ginsengisoli]
MAVLPVVAYHAGFSQIPGGFVGVDVFFVISGFLISGIVQDEIEAGRFSLISFYERRVRRILPALFVMMAAATAAAIWLLLPAELVAYGQSLAAATLSASNVWFWLKTDYFDEIARQAPLLHTWSLAVEEQFYLVLPGLLLLARGTSRRVLCWIIGALALASLAWSAFSLTWQPEAAYYLLPSRAWELALGALLAFGFPPASPNRWLREAAGFGGLAAIAYAVLTLTVKTPFPGLAALAPCLGTAAVLWAGQGGDSWVRRVMSFRPLVWVGLISYSLYLWHWPVIVFQNAGLLLGDDISPKLEKMILVTVSLALAWASWWFVERPFRQRGVFGRRTVFIMAGVGAASLVLVGLGLAWAQGLPGRLPAHAAWTGSWIGYDQRAAYREGTCFVTARARQSFDYDGCLSGDPGRPTYLLIGDSHAAALWSGLAKALPDANVLQATNGGCRPVFPSASSDKGCAVMMNRLFGRWIPGRRLDGVWLAGRWGEADLKSLFETAEDLKAQGVNVTVIGPLIRYDKVLPRLLVLSELDNDPGLPARHRLTEILALDARMKTMAARRGIEYLSLNDLICDAKACVTRTKDGVPLQFDGGHLTGEGSALVGALAAPKLVGP